jgi:uncharacterized protein YecT (DUF1311 family)
MPLSEAAISQAYQDLRTARLHLWEAMEAAIRAKEALTDAECELLLSGVVLGSNAQARENQVRTATTEQRTKVLNCEIEQRRSQCKYDF